VRLYAVESPESWFEDFGFGQLVDGRAEIQLDGDFSAVIDSDTYHVFITEYDDNNALYVAGRTSRGFEEVASPLEKSEYEVAMPRERPGYESTPGG
jgi:hypothetical protein